MTQCLLSIKSKLPLILQYSGKNFGHMGQYYQCLDQPKMLYNYVTFGLPDSGLGTQIGLCLPKQCTKQVVKTTLQTILKSLSIPLVVTQVNNDVPAYHYDYDWVFFLTFIIFITTIVLVMVSTLSTQNKGISMFSIQESRKLFKRNPNSNLNVLNGVRSLSMIWVIFGHSMSYTLSGSINITSSVESLSLLKPFYLIVQGGLFAVDVFFFVAGILLAYVFLRTNNSNLAMYPMALIQRILRFWPSYLFAMLVYYSVYLHLGEGPHWGMDESTVKFCSKIWKPLFFIDNIIDNGQTQCMAWGWYLQNDMQLFVLSLFVLLVYSFKPLISKILIFLLMIGSAIFTYQWTYDNGTYVISHLNDFSKWGEYMTNVYMKPWARATPYLWGLFIGILYSQNLIQNKKQLPQQTQQEQNLHHQTQTLFNLIDKKLKSNQKIRLLMQWTGIGIMIFLIVIVRTLQVGNQWPQQLHSLYQSLAKLIFVMGLSLTILPSLLGCKDSIINFTMDTRLFNFIAKISFCTYLIHLTILEIWVQSRTYSRYFTTIPTFVEFGGILMLSIMAGLIMTFLIELPFSKLQKQLINKVKNTLMGVKKQEGLSELLDDKMNKKMNQTVSSINLNKSLLTEN